MPEHQYDADDRRDCRREWEEQVGTDVKDHPRLDLRVVADPEQECGETADRDDAHGKSRRMTLWRRHRHCSAGTKAWRHARSGSSAAVRTVVVAGICADIDHPAGGVVGGDSMPSVPAELVT